MTGERAIFLCRLDFFAVKVNVAPATRLPQGVPLGGASTAGGGTRSVAPVAERGHEDLE